MELKTRTRFSLYFLILLNAFILPVCLKPYVARPGVTLKTYTVREERRVASTLECVASCEQTTWCLTVSWSSSLQPGPPCRMSDYGLAFWWPLDAIHLNLEADAEWTTYCKIKFSVAIFYRVDQVALDFSTASQACIDHGTVLATEAQVLAAGQLHGLTHCTCAYFASGNTGYVVDPALGCYQSAVSPQIVYCTNAHLNAWCVMR